MRVALFFDGKNFYHGLREVQTEYRINFPRLANWLREKTNGSVIVGAHYYTGVEPPDQELPESAGKLEGFLKIIQAQRGFYVHRFPRWKHTDICKKCGTEAHYTHEKQVDTSIVADMVKGAATDSYDIAVLLSGDADFIPAIDVVNSLGKQVFVATWNGVGQADRLRSVAYDIINLAGGMKNFREVSGSNVPRLSANQGTTSKPDEAPVEGDDTPFEPQPITGLDGDQQEFLKELGKAEEHFGKKRVGSTEAGYVGLGYFLTKWVADDLELDPVLRKEVLDELTAMGRVIVYDTGKGSMAIRRNSDFLNPDDFDIQAEWAEEEEEKEANAS